MTIKEAREQLDFYLNALKQCNSQTCIAGTLEEVDYWKNKVAELSDALVDRIAYHANVSQDTAQEVIDDFWK